MIRAVLFDVDNTVYNYDTAHEKAIKKVYLYCEKNFAWDKQTTEQLLLESQKEIEKVLPHPCSTLHNRLIRYQIMLENQGKPLFPHVKNLYHAYWDTLIEVMKAEPGILELFQFLKEKKIKIGIATDMTAYMQYEKLERLGLLSYVNFIVSSEEVGTEKPDSKLFYRCIQKAGCRAEECIMVGDNLEKDVMGAIKVGMNGVWYCPLSRREKQEEIQKEISGKIQILSSFSELRRCICK